MKINHLEVVAKILLFAAVIIITCILVWLGFRAADVAKNIGGNAITKMIELNNDIKDSDLKKYDGETVHGSEVVNAIKKYLGDYEADEIAPIYVRVITSTADKIYTNGSNLPDIRHFSSYMYIKPTAVFLGALVKNENDVILGLTFTQQ